MLDIITKVSPEFIAEFEDRFQATIPAEKVKADLAQAFIGRALIAEGSTRVDGIGQRMGEVDQRTYYRWQQSNPGCWQDKAFVNEFFADNAQLRDKGYTPKTNAARKGMTYIDGKPVR